MNDSNYIAGYWNLSLPKHIESIDPRLTSWNFQLLQMKTYLSLIIQVPTEEEGSKVVLISIVIAVIVGIPLLLFIVHKIRERSCNRASQAVARGKVHPSDEDRTTAPATVNTQMELDGGRKRVEPLPFY